MNFAHFRPHWSPGGLTRGDTVGGRPSAATLWGSPLPWRSPRLPWQQRTPWLPRRRAEGCLPGVATRGPACPYHFENSVRISVHMNVDRNIDRLVDVLWTDFWRDRSSIPRGRQGLPGPWRRPSGPPLCPQWRSAIPQGSPPSCGPPVSRGWVTSEQCSKFACKISEPLTRFGAATGGSFIFAPAAGPGHWEHERTRRPRPWRVLASGGGQGCPPPPVF